MSVSNACSAVRAAVHAVASPDENLRTLSRQILGVIENVSPAAIETLRGLKGQLVAYPVPHLVSALDGLITELVQERERARSRSRGGRGR